MKRYKWWIYTVLIGLVPFFARWFIYYISVQPLPPMYVLNEIDMVAFGLVMATTNINEIDNDDRFSVEWKGIILGLSIFILVFMAFVLGIAYYVDAFTVRELDRTKIKYASLIVSILSFVFSLAIVYKPRFLTTSE